MSDPRLDRPITIAGETHEIRFTHSGLAEAERLLGRQVPDIAMMVGSGRFGFADLIALTCAGLEGHRRKFKTHHKAWTTESVADWLDDADNFETAANPIVEAFSGAIERWFPDLVEEASDAVDGDEQDPPPAAGDGTDSSEPPSDPDLTSTPSGA